MLAAGNHVYMRTALVHNRREGRLTRPVLGRTVSDPVPQPSQPNHRISRRRPVTRRVGVILRKGALGLGPNLALNLIDVSEDGLGVRIKSALAAGDEVEVELSPPGVRKPYKRVGEVRWCRKADDETFLIGVRLQKRLTFTELNELAH
jgi:hypothetical protein